MHPETPRKERAPLSEAQQRLAVTYLPLARAMARPFKEQLPDVWEEFESAACLALVEAARAFDPARGVKFTTFCRRRISGALNDVRSERLRRTKVERSTTEDGAPIMATVEDLIGTEQPIGAEIEAVEAVEQWLRKIPKQHAETCRLIYLGEKTHAEVARILGFSSSRVTYLHLEALAMLGGTWKPGTRPLPPAPRRRGRPRRVVPA